MTDDEIDAVLMPELARYLECENGDLTIMESERIAFRAGMRRAARLVQFGDCLLDTQVYDSIARGRAVRTIERAAGGEG
jgi:hypothetical protein